MFGVHGNLASTSKKNQWHLKLRQRWKWKQERHPSFPELYTHCTERRREMLLFTTCSFALVSTLIDWLIDWLILMVISPSFWVSVACKITPWLLSLRHHPRIIAFQSPIFAFLALHMRCLSGGCNSAWARWMWVSHIRAQLETPQISKAQVQVLRLHG